MSTRNSARERDELLERVREEFPPEHEKRYTPHTTSESKAECEFEWLLEVIGKLYERLDAAEQRAQDVVFENICPF